MKKALFTVILSSVFLLSACKEEKENIQNKEAQVVLQEAQKLLEEIKQEKQKETPAPQKPAQYKEWLQDCVEKRNKAESQCAEKENVGEQAGCLVAASKILGLCMAENSFSQVQDKLISEGTILSEILGRTAADLEKWAKDNEGNLNDIAQGLAPFIEGLAQGEEGENPAGKILEEFFNNLAPQTSQKP